MRKKNKLLLIVLVVIAVLAAAGAAAWIGYNNMDHSAILGDENVARYNSAITASARAYNSIRPDEFVLIDTVSKELGGNTNITFRVYKLPEGATFTDYQHLRVQDVPANFVPEYVGNGTARLMEGSLERIIVSVTYYK